MALTMDRYLKGIIQAENISIPLDRLNHRLAERYDPELDAHINGHMYPYDILFTIDEEAKRGIKEVLAGRSVRLGLRKLICYALWGNPVDAYKWYQYQYQETNLSLCYLPEHLVLMEIPKADNYFSPRPDVTYGSKKYGYIRNSMARAHDEGIGRVFPSLSVQSHISKYGVLTEHRCCRCPPHRVQESEG